MIRTFALDYCIEGSVRTIRHPKLGCNVRAGCDSRLIDWDRRLGLLPASKAANDAKSGTHYREYMASVVSDEGRLARVEDFVRESGYEARIERFGDLRSYCEQQYRQIIALAEVNKTYLRCLVDVETQAPNFPPRQEETYAPDVEQMVGDPLPIRLVPPGSEFKRQLLLAKEAWVTTHYVDGRVESRRWDASRMAPTSNVIANLRSRPAFRKSTWRQRGISHVLVSIGPVH